MAKKKAKAKAKVWTELEVFFLQGNFTVFSIAELKEKLNCTDQELLEKVEELKLDVAPKKGLKGFETGKNKSIVAMTQNRSISDDRDAGMLPVELGGIVKEHPKNANMEKYKVN